MKLIVCVVVAAACGSPQRGGEVVSFECKDRSASYMATKHISGDEVGVVMDCKDAGPRVKRWKVSKTGQRVEDAHPISPVQFERAWREVNGTGWENLKDCANGSLGKHDPVYVFDIKDDQNSSSFQCQTVDVPFPYFDITQALNTLAQEGRKQLGDDEPADMKAIDKKDMQR